MKVVMVVVLRRRLAIGITCLIYYFPVATCGVTTIPCCALWDNIDMYIKARGGSRDKCPAECKDSHEVNQILKYTEAASVGQWEANGTNFVLDFDDMKVDLIAQIFVLSFIGRWTTKPSTGEDSPVQPYIQYDTIAHTTEIIQPACSFQKSFYTAMVLIAIIAIISLMLVQSASEIELERNHSDSEVTESKNSRSNSREDHKKTQASIDIRKRMPMGDSLTMPHGLNLRIK